MKLIFACCLILIASPAFGQNVGIGTATPTGPLSFPSTTGNKIVLWGDGNQSHYGIGIQGGLLQVYANQAGDAIALGYGRSGAFTERVRIPNSGDIGLTVNGRALLRNGTAPLDPAFGAGIWLTDPMNSTLQGFMGVQNSQNIGFFGGTAGWGFTYNTSNSRVGIGNTNPNAPLAFGATLGKKITLYPGTVGDAGFGMSGNRLQIFADNPNADVAMGYDAAGVFNERFAVKPNGALALVANTGAAGEIITSAGSGAAAYWSSPYKLHITGKTSITPLTSTLVQLNSSTINVNLVKPSRLVVYYETYTGGPQCFVGNCAYKWNIYTRVDGQLVQGGSYGWEGQYFIDGVVYAVTVQRGSSDSFGPAIFDLSAGAHIIIFEADAMFGEPHIGFRASYQIMPQ